MKSGRQSGFTLVELVIVMAIVAILAAVAFPAYQEQVRKGNRAAAQSEMMDIANRQQQFFLANRSYADSVDDLSYALPVELKDRYDDPPAIAVDNDATPPTFAITFTAKGSQASDGNLTLDSEGVKERDGDPAKW
jgi:type IV pilus assembly protein PilE